LLSFTTPKKSNSRAYIHATNCAEKQPEGAGAKTIFLKPQADSKRAKTWRGQPVSDKEENGKT
jgi:hypothetical protein